MKPPKSQICPPAHLLGCFWVQVGVQQGNGELNLPRAPGFHVCQKRWRDEKEEEEENGVIQAKTIQKEGKKLRERDWEEK